MCGVLAPFGEADGDEVDIKDDEDIEPLKSAPNPQLPTAKEIEDHRLIHVPFRCWCKWCVMGRGLGQQHGQGLASSIAIVGLDYFFITRGGAKKRNELEFSLDAAGEAALAEARQCGEIVKCLLLRCLKTKVIFAHVVPYKGAGEDQFVAGLVVDDVAWLGHTKLVVKSDNEPALQTLVTQALEAVRVRCEGVDTITQEHPAAYDSQSNGGVEVGVRLVRGLFRTLKLCVEARLDRYVPVSHALIPWLLQHTCLILNVRSRGDDGLTAWERARGRPFNQRLVGFVEKVMYKLPSKGPQSQPDGNMGALWADGIFLGYDRNSNTYIVGNADGVRMSRSLARRPIEERWCADAAARLTATPWSLYERPAAEARFNEPATAHEEAVPVAAPPAIRRMRINKRDLEVYGYTAGCPQCRHTQAYGTSKPGGSHTTACRSRLLEAMKAGEVGRQRVERYEEQLNRNIAERIERADGAPAPAPQQPERAQPAAPPLESRSPEERAPEAAASQAAASTSPDMVRSGERSRVPADEAAVPKPRVRLGEDHPAGPRRGSTPARGQGCAAQQPPSGHPTPTDAGIPTNTNDADMEEDSGQRDDHREAEGDVPMSFIGSLEPAQDDVISSILLQQLGSVGRRYKRESRSAYKKIVSEIYSPPRVTREIGRSRGSHLMAGFALDLTVVDPDDGLPWDFTSPAKQAKARKMLREQKPYFLIGSPMCRQFSTWQALNNSKNPNKEEIERAYTEAVGHLNFVTSLYIEQIEGGRYFLHEHPRYATSWTVEAMEELKKIPGVQISFGDQCQYGAEVRSGPERGSPVKKPTGFLSNSPQVLRSLERKCSGGDGSWACSRTKGGKHVLCSGKVAREAAIYPRELCRAILRGITRQLHEDRRLKDGCFGVQAEDDEEEIMEQCRGPEEGYSGKYRDDLTGQVLKDELVTKARRTELDFFHSKGVWVKQSIARARQQTGKAPISVRWVDVNKGDEASPKYRSRLVARQMRAHDHSGASYFAPAPPLEALRTVLSLAVTSIGGYTPDTDPLSPTRTQLSFLDVARAYFNAKVDPRDPPVFVSLPAEDPDHRDMCARLLRHMYGTRMAADGWQEEYSTLLIELGFRQGTACPNLFHHESRGIKCSVHGDDFTSCGGSDQLDWFEKAVAERYEVTVGPRLGPGPDDAKEALALNRVVRWTEHGIEYEADPRQSERLVSECGLTGANSMATPGVRPTAAEITADEELPKHLCTAFRGAAARGNYLAADRIDAQFACKEVCRHMARPTTESWKALKRVCRFLNGHSRLVYTFPRQRAEGIDVYSDTDWAGCPRTRKSTSGGCVLLGQHAVKHWSSTQASTALSSGEAEFNGVVRAAGQGLGYQALLHDLGVDAPLRVWTDSSAAVGICSRQGLGKLRHLDTQTLWVQQAVRTGRIDLRKVLGEENPADLLTKHSLTKARLLKLVELHGCRYRGGRAESAPQLRKGDSEKFRMADAQLNVDLADEPAPFMPHLEYSREELDQRHPKLEAPDEELLDSSHEAEADARDSVLQHGLSVARQIEDETTRFGRTRRTPTDVMSPTCLPNRSTVKTSNSRPQLENAVVKGRVFKSSRVNGRNGATNSPGPSDRRRSEKLRPPLAANCFATPSTSCSRTSVEPSAHSCNESRIPGTLDSSFSDFHTLCGEQTSREGCPHSVRGGPLLNQGSRVT